MRYGRGLTAKADGTRVRLFPQPSFLPRRRQPETVLLSPRAGSVGPGPADSRMYVVHPLGHPPSLRLLPAPPPPPPPRPRRPPRRPPAVPLLPAGGRPDPPAGVPLARRPP